MLRLRHLVPLLLVTAVVTGQERNNWSWGPDGAGKVDPATSSQSSDPAEVSSGRSSSSSTRTLTIVSPPAAGLHLQAPGVVHSPPHGAPSVPVHVTNPVQRQGKALVHAAPSAVQPNHARKDGQSEGRFLGLKDKLCEHGIGFDCKKGYYKGGYSHHDISYVQPVQVVAVGGPIASVPIHHKAKGYGYAPPVPVYNPPPPAPPPVYHAPQPSYGVPAPTYHAPQPTYGAPAVNHQHTHHHSYDTHHASSYGGYAKKDNSFGSSSPLSLASSSFGKVDKLGSSLPVVPPRPSPLSSFSSHSSSSSLSSFSNCQCVEARYCPLSDVVPRSNNDILPLINARNKKTDILSTAGDEAVQAASEDSPVVVESDGKDKTVEDGKKEEGHSERRRRDTVIFEDKKRDTRDTMVFRESFGGRPPISANSRLGNTFDRCQFGQVCCRNPSFRQQREISTCGRNRNAVGLLGRVKNPRFQQGDTEFGEYPWHAAILRREHTDNVYVCGAALIDSLHLLTAAHCVSGLSPSDLKVRLGEWDVGSETEFYRHQEREVSGLYSHPEFYSGNLNNDIAVIKVHRPIDMATNPHISPVCLPERFASFHSQRCHVSGWGKDAFGRQGSFQHVLKEVDLPMVDHRSCESVLRSTRLGGQFNLHEGMICAGGEEGKDACEGDGGSPLVCQGFDGSVQLAGLVSWGLGCGQRGLPGVYTNVAHYTDWINSITRRF
ncbi:hypothetical protein Pmani_009518 [Petrolisthes manimaculis]|uniref:Peptidase S1 domain-containing protein n=1 Tax=Petrolisthes manimaculis TaxID=1843537 RepID=A0AAE1UCT1_9EUCA|nr:hypothetical protein Pmani_009518 [Petrolisthes manimaculis]